MEQDFEYKSIRFERFEVFGFMDANAIDAELTEEEKRQNVLSSLEFLTSITTKRHLVSQCAAKWKLQSDHVDVDFLIDQEGRLLRLLHTR